MKLITEYNDNIRVTQNEKKEFIIEGVFSTANVKNNNNRIYKKELLEREVSKIQEKIRAKTAFGELNHPETPEIDLSKVCMLVTELKWRNNDVMGKAKILNTPNGKIAKELIKEGSVGISSRGLGTVSEDGYVNEDLSILCYDLVSNPSNPGSWVNGILEGKEFTKEDIRKLNIMKKDYFKWNSWSEGNKGRGLTEVEDFVNWKPKQKEYGKIDKSMFKWGNEKLNKKVDKIDKSQFRFKSDGITEGFRNKTVNESSPYGSTEMHTNWERHSKIIYVDKTTREVMYDPTGFYMGSKMSDTDIVNARRRSYTVVFK